MPDWLTRLLDDSQYFMPHGHCYLWLPSVLWLHVGADVMIGCAYFGISLLLWGMVRRLKLPFSPVFIAFGLFIALCGGTHLMQIWTVWQPDYIAEGLLKAATALASVATAIGLLVIKPRIQDVVQAARLSGERREELERAHAELKTLYAKVKELDELKSRFFANVSHELRTPLALLLGPAQQLLDDPALGEPQRRRVRTMRDNGQVLLKHVNDLLDLAKLDAQRLQLRYAEVDATAALRRIAAQFDVAAEQRLIALRLDLPDKAPAQLDPDQFDRIVVNLLSNAFKFTPSGGVVTAALALRDDALVLTVADTGPGVEPSQRELIFERFRQADGADTRRHAGTGLGLAIVKDFVTLHGGHVNVGAAEQGGARFTVTLPRAAPAGTVLDDAPASAGPESRAVLAGALHGLRADTAAAVPAERPTGPRPQVLVVEDNAEMREFIAGVLDRDFDVFTAPDGETALAEADALRPDLIVTDLMMPRMSGEQLVRALRERPALDHTPVLLLSAKADEQLRVRLLGNGAQDCLAKPFLPDELLARAANWVQVKRAGDTLRGELASASSDLATLADEVTAKNRQLLLAVHAAEEARAKSEHTSQIKSHFLGLLSHEVRTPLSTMAVNLHLLARLGATLPTPVQTAVDRLRGASGQLRAMVEGLLEYSRIESGVAQPQRQPVDLVELTRSVVQACLDDPAGVPVPLRFEPPAVPLPMLQADPRLLAVAMTNLVGNAVKFTRKGQVVVRLALYDGCPVIEVVDTGVGIPADALERIFLPFEQLEPLPSKSTPGLGLGLALVRQIVEALRGRVEVASDPGAGSTFRVVLPRVDTAPEPRPHYPARHA